MDNSSKEDVSEVNLLSTKRFVTYISILFLIVLGLKFASEKDIFNTLFLGNTAFPTELYFGHVVFLITPYLYIISTIILNFKKHKIGWAFSIGLLAYLAMYLVLDSVLIISGFYSDKSINDLILNVLGLGLIATIIIRFNNRNIIAYFNISKKFRLHSLLAIALIIFVILILVVIN